MMDYTTLRVIWWLLLGFLLVGFAIMDGFDLGVATLLPWLARNDMEKRILMNTIAPIWEGNQVWIILAGGAIFAAWPYLYAASFSGFYLAMLFVLAGFILRPVSMKYRSKIPHPTWRATWDVLLMLSGFIPSLIFGVAMGNVLQGVPFHFDEQLRFFYTGSFGQLLNPFALLCGLLSLMMISMHGAVYLANKTDNLLQQRARKAIVGLSGAVVILFGIGGLWVARDISGYALLAPMLTDAPSNPLHKTVVHATGQWFHNYHHYPLVKLVPLAGFLGALLTAYAAWKRFFKAAFLASALCIAGIISTVGVSMFPVLLPSSENPSHSLLVWDASSSQNTLWLMLLSGLIFFPIIIAYTSWIYRVMRGPVTEASVESHSEDYY